MERSCKRIRMLGWHSSNRDDRTGSTHTGRLCHLFSNRSRELSSTTRDRILHRCALLDQPRLYIMSHTLRTLLNLTKRCISLTAALKYDCRACVRYKEEEFRQSV